MDTVIIQRHDFIGMNYSLEVRPPFLDHKFVEIINSLPVKNKFNSSTGKIILKRYLKSNLNILHQKIRLEHRQYLEKFYLIIEK